MLTEGKPIDTLHNILSKDNFYNVLGCLKDIEMKLTVSDMPITHIPYLLLIYKKPKTVRTYAYLIL